MNPRLDVLTKIGYLCTGGLGLLMGFLCYLGPSPALNREHAGWWAWVITFTALLLVGVPSSFLTRGRWPDYVVAFGAMLLLTWQTRSAIAVLDVHPPFHSSPWTVVIVVAVLLLELVGFLSAVIRLSRGG
jgi:hypothetical protein